MSEILEKVREDLLDIVRWATDGNHDGEARSGYRQAMSEIELKILDVIDRLDYGHIGGRRKE